MEQGEMGRTCALCGEAITVGEQGVYTWTAGWIRRGSHGGLNALRCPTPTKVRAHGFCVSQAARGIDPRQTRIRVERIHEPSPDGKLCSWCGKEPATGTTKVSKRTGAAGDPPSCAPCARARGLELAAWPQTKTA